VNKGVIRARPGWADLRHVYEVKSTYILQPGPAALTEGLRQLHVIIAHVAGCSVPQELQPAEKIDPELAR
jgi:iron complex transport system substrate-binding protein